MPYPREANPYRIDFEDGDFYVGSTKLKRLSTRIAEHRSHTRHKKTKCKIHNKIREMGLHSFQYVLLGSKIINNYEEQRKYEQEWITRLKPTLNTNRAHVTPEQQKEDSAERWKMWVGIPENREKARIISRKRRKTREKWYCEVCDQYYTHPARHKRSLKHLPPEDREKERIRLREQRKETGRTWNCELCNQNFAFGSGLYKHKKTKRHLARV